ncbi:hypothetical protein DPMN_084914 [Dreissena polymorpha]|uniref:Uncharacterized protein n=1 Tax=Dreissena polymorpha TaxID=45954 RepID=A0A9D3YBN5_DREPO|nr:hypothetical protein DPMN_084914 [Dreissena polymorpha]
MQGPKNPDPNPEETCTSKRGKKPIDVAGEIAGRRCFRRTLLLQSICRLQHQTGLIVPCQLLVVDPLQLPMMPQVMLQ